MARLYSPRNPLPTMTRPTRQRLAIGVALLLVLSAFAYFKARTGSSTPYSRGAALVDKLGCLACHGGLGSAPTPNPSRDPAVADGTIPPLIGCEVEGARFAEWILLGAPASLRSSGRWLRTHAARSIEMPSFAAHIDASQVDDIRAWARVAARPASRPSLNSANPWARAEALAARHSCFACHGELGQGGIKNPGSLTGEVPALVGADFQHLTDGGKTAAVLEWIESGHSDQFIAGRPLAPIARYFMENQRTQMPAFGALLDEGELNLLVEYCLKLHELGPLSAESYKTYCDLVANPPPQTPLNQDLPPPVGVPLSEALPAPIAALFSEACIHCHGPKKQKSEYRMDTRTAAFAAADIASYLEVENIAPGAPSKSLLYTFLTLTEEDPENELFPMPPDEVDRLSPEELKLVHDWIVAGAPWHPSQTLTSTHSD